MSNDTQTRIGTKPKSAFNKTTSITCYLPRTVRYHATSTTQDQKCKTENFFYEVIQCLTSCERILFKALNYKRCYDIEAQTF